MAVAVDRAPGGVDVAAVDEHAAGCAIVLPCVHGPVGRVPVPVLGLASSSVDAGVVRVPGPAPVGPCGAEQPTRGEAMGLDMYLYVRKGFAPDEAGEVLASAG